MKVSRATQRKHARASVTLAMAGLVVVVSLALGGSAQAVTPTAVLLGTAGQFAVLAGTGITNGGATTISGDTGSSATPTEVGFAACPAAACVTQLGTNHVSASPNDSTTQGAKAALTTAVNDAAGRTPTTVLTELGGQTLVAGVYTAASTTFGMTGTLTLDGANNADSVFIFQAPGGMTTTGGAANVVLVNGAQPCNVFWEVATATLSGASSFTGTLMSAASITVGAAATINGRLLAGTGDVTLSNDTITMPSTCLTQASVNAGIAAAAAAAQAATAQAAAAAQAAQTAANEAAAAQAAADKAAAATAAATAAQAASDKAAAAAAAAAVVQAAQVAAAKAAAALAAANAADAAAAKAAAAAKVAAAKAAVTKLDAAKVAAAKAAAAAKLAAEHAAAAKAAAARGAAAARAAAARAAAAKATLVRAAHVHAHAARTHVGLTG